MSTKTTVPAQSLKKRTIYNILDGDAEFYSHDLNEQASLPYQSGRELIEILRVFGLQATDDKASRWTHVEKLLDYCIESQQISKLFNYFFNLRQFRKDLHGLTAEEADKRHVAIVTAAIDAINGELFFDGHRMERTGNNYSVVPIDGSPTIETPTIKQVDRSYIKEVAERAQHDVNQGDYDSALTKARTLLEEVFCRAIERAGETPLTGGNINKLFSQAKNLYNIHADENTDRRICELINGLNKIVDSIGQMRNKQSDAHGVGAARVNIENYHARLAVNAAASVADFMLSVVDRAENRQTQEKSQESV